MNRKLKKMAAAFLTLVMLLAAMPGQLLVSYAASGKITFSDPTVSVGNQVSVTMKIASSDGTGLGNSDVMLEYDASALEFLSGTNANGGAGSIRVVGNMESASQTTFSFTLKFKALKAGTTSITVRSQEVYDADSRTVTIDHVGSSSIKVNASANASADADLKSLTISPGTLSPAFSADVTEYTATVSESVDRITVSAPANDGNASVVVEGADALEMGENPVVCRVTAEDGETTKTYTITVTKVEGEVPGEDDQSTPANAGADGGIINVEDGNWTASSTIDESTLPDGFTVTDYEYEGETIQAGINDQGVVLIYMTDENGNGDYFVYNEDTGVLAPYVTVRMAEKIIIVLPPEEIPEGTSLPEGFKECTIDIGDHTVHGWIWNSNTGEAPEYCIVYGQNADGERYFYRYDQKEMTLQRFFRDPDAEELRKTNAEIVTEYNSLVDDYTIRGYMIAGLFGVCILLVIILIILLLTRKPRNTYDSYDEPKGKKEKKSGRKKAGKEMNFDDFDDEEPVRKTKAQARRKPQRAYEDEDLDELELEDLDDEEEKELHAIPVRSRKSVADLERDLADDLAREAAARGDSRRPSVQGDSRESATQGDARRSAAQGDSRKPATQVPVQKSVAGAEAKTADDGDLDDDFEFIDLDL